MNNSSASPSEAVWPKIPGTLVKFTLPKEPIASIQRKIKHRGRGGINTEIKRFAVPSSRVARVISTLETYKRTTGVRRELENGETSGWPCEVRRQLDSQAYCPARISSRPILSTHWGFMPVKRENDRPGRGIRESEEARIRNYELETGPTGFRSSRHLPAIRNDASRRRVLWVSHPSVSRDSPLLSREKSSRDWDF